MKLILLNCTLSIAVWLAFVNPSLTTAGSPAVMATFVGTTPCGQMIRPLFKVAEQTDCALVEWTLTLYQDAVTHEPTTFKLTSINRYVVEGTNMYSEPGTKSATEGKWSIVKGNGSKRNAIIYRLNPGHPTLSMSFLKLSDNLIHALDPRGNLMVGNAFHNYTLTRTGN